METKQKIIAQKLGKSESYISLIFGGHKPISRPLAEKLSIMFPDKDYNFWRAADPEELKRVFGEVTA